MMSLGPLLSSTLQCADLTFLTVPEPHDPDLPTAAARVNRDICSYMHLASSAGAVSGRN